MSQASSERGLLGLVLVAFLVCLFNLNGRYKAEKANQTTEIVLDAKALRDWRQVRDDLSPEKLKQAGLSSLAVHELLLDDLLEQGKATPFTATEFRFALRAGSFGEEAERAEQFHSQIEGLGPEATAGTYLYFESLALAESVHQHLEATLGGTRLDGHLLWIPMTTRALKVRGLGFDREEVRALVDQGFAIWLRPQNIPGITEAQLEALVGTWGTLAPESSSIHGVVFGGGANEALGYPDRERLQQSASLLAARGWNLGYIELAPKAQQDGIESMVRAEPGNVTRVLAVSAPHQAKLSPDRVLGMYSLGSRERNIRALYVRPFAIPNKPELDDEFLFSLNAELAGQAGRASAFSVPSPAPHPGMTAVAALGAGALALLLLQAMGWLQAPALWWGAILILPLLGEGAALAIGKDSLFRSALALGIGMAGPCLAFLRFLYPSLAASDPRSHSLLEGARLLFLLSLASLASGLCAAALLPDTTFLLGLDRFRGVKLLTLGTPLLIVGLFTLKHYPVAELMKGAKANIQVYQAALVGGLGLVFGFLYLRTGNDAGGAASEWERNLRVVMDRILGVRPRFKEFLVAHPALICGPFLARKTGFLPSLVLVLLAAVGQAGIVDTFAHIHTPLDVTLIRVILGVVFGLLFGFIAWGILSVLWSLMSKWLSRYNIGSEV